MTMDHKPVSVASVFIFDSSPFAGFGWEASSCNFAESLAVRASAAGPKTFARRFALLRLEALARTLFAIFKNNALTGSTQGSITEKGM